MVNSTVLTFLHARFRSAAPVTPHIILLGPTGAGKSVQAAILTEKYQIVNGKMMYKKLVFMYMYVYAYMHVGVCMRACVYHMNLCVYFAICS